MKRKRLTKNQVDEAVIRLEPLSFKPCVHMGISFGEVATLMEIKAAYDAITESVPTMDWWTPVALSSDFMRFTSIMVEDRHWSFDNPIHEVAGLARMLKALFPDAKVWGGWHERTERSPCQLAPLPTLSNASIKRMVGRAIELRNAASRTVQQVVEALPLVGDQSQLKSVDQMVTELNERLGRIRSA